MLNALSFAYNLRLAADWH